MRGHAAFREKTEISCLDNIRAVVFPDATRAAQDRDEDHQHRLPQIRHRESGPILDGARMEPQVMSGFSVCPPDPLREDIERLKRENCR